MVTEFEIFEALRVETAFSVSVGEQSLTLLTGHLIVALFIGSKLTFFQVSFVNVVFWMMFLSSSFALVGTMPILHQLAERLIATGSEIPMGTAMSNPVFTVIVTLLMYLSAGSISHRHRCMKWVCFSLLSGKGQRPPRFAAIDIEHCLVAEVCRRDRSEFCVTVIPR
jgi:hypothetical protein